MDRTEVSIHPAFCIGMAAAVMVLPIKWVIAWFAACFVHELCHYIMLISIGVPVYSIRIGISGVIMETEEMNPKQEMLCALAGPLGGIALLVGIRLFPRIAICGVIQSLFNLLPIYTMDGGRCLSSALTMVFGTSPTDRMMEKISWLTIGVLFVTAVYCSLIFDLGPLPVLATLIVALRNRKSKCSCKDVYK